MGDSIGSGVFLFFAIYFACLYEFFVDMPVFFTSFFSVNFIISMSDGLFTANAGLQFGFFVPVIVSEIVCNIFYKDGERKVIENIKGETVGMIGLFNRFLQFSDSI